MNVTINKHLLFSKNTITRTAFFMSWQAFTAADAAYSHKVRKRLLINSSKFKSTLTSCCLSCCSLILMSLSSSCLAACSAATLRASSARSHSNCIFSCSSSLNLAASFSPEKTKNEVAKSLEMIKVKKNCHYTQNRAKKTLTYQQGDDHLVRGQY